MAELQSTSISGSLDYLKEEILTTTNITLALSHVGKVITCNNSSGTITVTIPNDTTVNFPIGSFVFISRIGQGDVSIAAFTDIVLNGATVPSNTNYLGKFEEIMLRKRAANSWQLLEEKVFYRTGSGGNSATTSQSHIVHQYTSTGGNNFTVN